jgi:hypothetical protein
MLPEMRECRVEADSFENACKATLVFQGALKFAVYDVSDL